MKSKVSQLFMLGIEDPSNLQPIQDFEPGSVILTMKLFKRQGSSQPETLRQLCDEIHSWDSEPLIGIHHEGVFRNYFWDIFELSCILMVCFGERFLVDTLGGFIQHLPPPNYTWIPPAGGVGMMERGEVEMVGRIIGKELRAVGW